jgi:hypothetical protein
MDTIASIFVTLIDAGVATCKWLFTAFFVLFIPFLALGALSLVTENETLLLAALIVRITQGICLLCFLLSGALVVVSFGTMIAVGYVGHRLGFIEDFSL